MAVETGAGSTASGSDEEYEAAGASVADRESVLKDADIILGVQGPDPASLAGLKPGAWLVAGLNPFGERARVDAYAGAGDRKSVVEGKSVSVRVDIGGRRMIKQKHIRKSEQSE